MRSGLWIAIVAACAAAIVGGTSAARAYPDINLHGRVLCYDHHHVVGVFIEGHYSRGWAHWSHVEGKPFMAHYSFAFANRGAAVFSIHVGCGGTHQDWATNNKSGEHRARQREVFDFVCYSHVRQCHVTDNIGGLASKHRPHP